MTRPRLPRLRAATRLAALALATAAVLAIAAPANAAAPTGRYVALGDSFTSGPLIPTQVDLNCVRSNRNYPSLVAASIHSSSFADVSCGGADHRRHPQPRKAARPARAGPDQRGQRRDRTGDRRHRRQRHRLLQHRLHLRRGRASSNPFGTPCKNRYTAGGTDQLQARIAATAPKVASVLQAVHAAAPSARVSSSATSRSCRTPASAAGRPYRSRSATCRTCVASRSRSTHARQHRGRKRRHLCRRLHALDRARRLQEHEHAVDRRADPGNSAAPFHPNAAGEQRHGQRGHRPAERLTGP